MPMPQMVSLPCPGWALLPKLYTPDGLNVFLAVRFFSVSYPGRVLRFFVIPLGVPYMVQFTSVLTLSFFVS